MQDPRKNRRSSFFKVPEGEIRYCVVAGEVLEFQQNFETREYFPVEPTQYDQEGRALPVRYMVNVFPVENSIIHMHPMKAQFPQGVYEEIYDQFQKDSNVVFEIKRLKGRPVKYDVRVSRKVTPEEAAQIQTVPLLPLKLPEFNQPFDPDKYGN